MVDMVTQEQALSLLTYDPDTGLLYWKQRKGGKKPVGSIAGRLNDRGYVELYLLGRQYRAHRIIWLMQFGSWPVHEIDHINGIKNDNRIVNLRDVPRELNVQNKPSVRANQTGYPGVHRKKLRFTAQIKAYGVRYRLGSFRTAEDAHQAYMEAKAKLHTGAIHDNK